MDRTRPDEEVRTVPADLTPAQQRALAQRLVGRRVRWAADTRLGDGEEAMTVLSAFEGMLRVSGQPGEFAPTLFKVLDGVGVVDGW